MKTRSCKSVTFSETSTLFIIDNLAASPAKSCIWFTRYELDSFKANARAQARAVRKLLGSLRTPEAGDILGMKNFLTQELNQEYVARRRRHTHAVLDEARSQRLARAEALRAAPDGLGARHDPAGVDRLAIASAEDSR